MAALEDPRQEKFCRLMAVGGKTRKQAAIDAGYSAKSASQGASRLLTKAHIVDRVAELKAGTEKKIADVQIESIDEQSKVRKFWLEVIEDKEERMSNRLKASELYGKSIAAFVEKREVSGKDGEPITFRWAGDDG
jgi:phage terminase small subunit